MIRRTIRRLGTITNWHESEIIIDRKSKFQARNVNITSESEIPQVLSQFKQQHKSIAKNASHPHMLAWRTGEVLDGKQTNIKQGFKDNGESGAGSKILELLIKHNIVNVLVIVTRWYGGTPLGGSRFRHITNTTLKTLQNSNKL
ncbi:uncharacterized protein SPAPADRAFT_152072 [Spathaspora passalidarum NRRL Y-27907]|uniref:Impact N-terminal domain-containing protein n=1 Tax=Spathaspora passalidarum (strain NRRL Y-27907 / 11-Y1) TaxID=619300 RepID=G3AN56_SPAPN|nr:uncharacterized protein SPAPADRAFT_152072 [Spathaspora passalidarum NRRL Y-27907]EGW31898.1 hypothetical protein SPAPADRAFT_152072 [Spathaspora passalidarum NRRL Y-27907]